MNSVAFFESSRNQQLASCDLLLKSKIIEFADFLAKRSISIPPGNEKSWLAYMAKDLQDRERIVKQFAGYADLCIEGGHNNIDLNDARSTLEWAQFRLKVAVNKDFFEKLDKEDLIEVFDSKNIQVFRNLRFFDITNYSLLDLLTYSWDVLYQREEIITRMLIKVVDQLQRGQICQAIPVTIPPHTLKEVMAAEVQTQLVTLKYLAPTKNLVTGDPAGFVVSSTVLPMLI